MLDSAKQTKKIDLNYIINHQSFRVAYIVLCNLQNTNSQILPTKHLQAILLLIINEKKERKKNIKTYF